MILLSKNICVGIRRKNSIQLCAGKYLPANLGFGEEPAATTVRGNVFFGDHKLVSLARVEATEVNGDIGESKTEEQF